MPTTPTDQHSLAPAEQYLRALWDARLLYLAIVALFVAGAMAVTALTPKTYSSQATLSVRQAPNLTANGLLYDSVTQIPPRDQLLAVTPVLFSRRLSANKTVTLAAQDVGIIDTNTHLDDTDVTKWVATELIEKTDMLSLTVNQPSAELAQKFAQRIVARTVESSRVENSSADTRKMLAAQVERAEAELNAAEARVVELDAAGSGAGVKARRDRAALDLDASRKEYVPLRRRLNVIDLLLAEQQLQLYEVDPPTLPLRPSFPRPVLNISVGLILGLLAATLTVIVRSIFKAPAPRSR